MWPFDKFIHKQVRKEMQVLSRQFAAAAERVDASNARNVASYDFNGEKHLGDAGPIVSYRLQYNELRIRSWQAMLESDIAQTAVNRLISWTLSKGLKPQCEPVEHILENEGLSLDKKKFTKGVETSFNLYRKSKTADFAGMKSLNELCRAAEKNAIVGGDVLVVLRVVNNCVKVQLIDGTHIQSPEYGSEFWPKVLANGNRIVDGVELSKEGQHLAYYVRVSAVSGGNPIEDFKFERIPARGPKSGMLMAYLYYGAGSEYRLNNVRGIPLISAVMEKINMIQQYTTATLKQAKVSSEVSFFVEHDKDAEGKNPIADKIVAGYDLDAGKDLATTDDGTQVARNLHINTGNETYNLPPGATLKSLENKNPLYFKEFFETNSEAVYAVLQIPPNVAMSKYNDSFSASRAALKDWEHTLVVKRDHHQSGFLQPIFNLWLELEILNNYVSAPGYIMAKANQNYRVIEAYQNIRFVGPGVPHIDPVKEVTAARLKLGSAAGHLPLDDLESTTEQLGGGESEENIEQLGRELENAESAGIKLPEPKVPTKAPGKKP